MAGASLSAVQDIEAQLVTDQEAERKTRAGLAAASQPALCEGRLPARSCLLKAL